jgi:hypothetical protein
MMVMEGRSMESEPLPAESPDPALGKEDGAMRCAVAIVGERFSGAGTWNREARRVTLLAAELGAVLDEETLILCDVRDLMALRLCLQRALAGQARRPWAILRRQSSGVSGQWPVVRRQRFALWRLTTDACGTATVGAICSAALTRLAHALGYRPTR